MGSHSPSAGSSHLLTPPLCPKKFVLDGEADDMKENVGLPKPDRPDSLNFSPSSFFSSNTFLNKDGLTSPRYFSTPKLETRDRRFVRYNSQPARRINFTRISSSGKPLSGVPRTPVLDFTKLKDAITPDSGFCTPAVDGFDCISSPPILSSFTDSNSDKCDTVAPSDAVPSFQEQMSLPTSSSALAITSPLVQSNSKASSSTNKMSTHHVSDDSVLDKSLDLPSWLSSFCQAQSSLTSSSCTPSSKAKTVQKKVRGLSSHSHQPKSIAKQQPASLPDVLSMPQLTPIPVIMAPTLPRFAACLPDTPLTSQAKPQKRKALKELQTNTLSNQQSGDERPNHSYMDLIKMALESAADGQMTLKEIILWIEDHFPYFKLKAKHTWKNSIRHNLSLHHDFIKGEERRHGGKWKLAAHAKKYAHRIPKPPVVKRQPTPPPPVVCLKKRQSGLQPILPKTMKSMNYTLVPIALAAVDCQETSQDSLADEHLFQPEPHQTSVFHLEPEPQQDGQQGVQLRYQAEQNNELYCFSEQEQQQQQHKPGPSVSQPKEVKLHFRLTQEQQQLLRLEQTQRQRQSLLGSGSLKSQRKERQSDRCHRSKFQPSNSISQNFPLLHMSDYRKNLKVKSASTGLPPIAPKPYPTSVSSFLAGQPNCFPNSDAVQLQAMPLPKSAKQGIPKNRNICRILDRMPKSKSFDGGRKMKTVRKVTKITSKLSNSKAAMIREREDMQAAEEINKILQDDENFPGSVHVGSSFEENLTHARLDESRPESEPGRDLFLQVWEDTMSPVVWDEDSQSSWLSGGVDDKRSHTLSGHHDNQALSSISLKAPKSWHEENTFNFDMNGTRKSHKTEDEVRSAENNLSTPILQVSAMNSRDAPLSEVQSRFSNSPAVEKAVKSMQTAENLAPSGPEDKQVLCPKTQSGLVGHDSQSKPASASATPQQGRPGLYRTKSRRKQIHVPLVIDLSPKRDTARPEQHEPNLSASKVCGKNSLNEKFRHQHLGLAQANLPKVAKPSTTGDIPADHTHVSNKPNPIEEDGLQKSHLTRKDEIGVPRSTELRISLPVSKVVSADKTQPVSEPSQGFGYNDISSHLSVYPSMGTLNTDSAGSPLSFSPSTNSFYHPSLALDSASSDVNQDATSLSSVPVQATRSTPKLSTPDFFAAAPSLLYSDSCHVPVNTNSGFVSPSSLPSPLKREDDSPGIPDETGLSHWQDGRNIYETIAGESNMSTATDSDAFPHFVSLGHKPSPFPSAPNYLIQSIPSHQNAYSYVDVIGHSYLQSGGEHSINQQMPSTFQMATEENASFVRKNESSEPLRTHTWSDRDIRAENVLSHYSPSVSALQPLTSENYYHYHNLNIANKFKGNLFRTNPVQSELNYCGAEDDFSSQTFSAISSDRQPNNWSLESSVPSSSMYTSTPSTATTTAIINNSENTPIFQQQQGERKHALSDESFPTFHQQQFSYIQQYQEDCHHQGESLHNFPTFHIQTPGLHEQCQATDRGAVESSSAVLTSAAAVPQLGMSANEYAESIQRSPPGEDVLDTATASDSSFLNSSVFDNIDSLMQTSLTEPNFLLKDES
ncbi:forkhead box protein M1 [Elysia marginata]|uniref:Forkhead box protein M1 n=1 Tax=Elysia marginata TaxID=1093978 RepID=A0AAV4JER0_9GAST|nr:forkhead box protein M1 [Elysia marginata]